MNDTINQARSQRIEAVVAGVSEWDGVVVRPHRYGGTEFVLCGREIGHVHRSGAVDIDFPRRMRDLLVAAEYTGPNPLSPDSGWTTYRLTDRHAVGQAIWLLRLSYLFHARALVRTPRGRALFGEFDPQVELASMDLDPPLVEAMSGRKK